MAGEDLVKRIEELESRIEELQDLELTNKIELLELKSLLKNAQQGQLPVTQGPVTPGVPPPPKEIIKAIEDLFKIQNAVNRRLDMFTEELERMRQLRTNYSPPTTKAAPAPPKVGELHIADIRSKIEETKRIMGRQ